MNLLKCISLLLLLGIPGDLLRADWNPKYLPYDSAYTLTVLKDPKLGALENRVFQYLTNSWCTQEKAKLLMELVAITHPQVCVEIGAFTGSSTLPILAALQYLEEGRAYVIEAWSNQEAIKGLPLNDPNTAWWGSLDMGALKNQFLSMIQTWSLPSTYQLLHMTSQQAISQVPEINFLLLDGNCSEEGSLVDSELYVSKVVPGGYVLLANVLVTIGGKATKMRALLPLFEQCDIICEIDKGNALLFRKKQS